MVAESIAPTYRPLAVMTLLAALTVIGTPAPAFGQGTATPARTLTELRSRVRPGDVVRIRSEAGEDLEASFVGIVEDRGVLVVDAAEIRLSLPARGIHEIYLRVPDPLRNGLLQGIGVGLATALLLTAVTSDDTNGRELLGFSLFTVPIGAGVGAGIDAMHHGQEFVFQQARPRSTSFGAVPVASGRWVFSLTVSW